MRRLTSLILPLCIVAWLAAPTLAAEKEKARPLAGDPIFRSVIGMADAMAETATSETEARTQQEGDSSGRAAEGAEPSGKEGAEGEDVQDNGTNPASLGFKFMPYYRYTELNSGVKAIEDLVLFAMIGIPQISPFTAAVLEWPVQKTLDFGAVAEGILQLPDDIVTVPEIPCGPPTCGGNVPLPTEGLARGFDISGVGDFRLRFLQGIKMVPGKKPGAATVLLVGADIMMPAASDPILGDETWYGSPIFAHVHNLNPTTFFAFLHFYFTDWAEKSGADPINQDKEIGFYMGRWFYQKAWLSSGYYVLPEMQVIYDNESDAEWSVMFLPEVGKSWQAGKTGLTAYIKPGWAIDGPDASERRFSVEMGLRMIPMPGAGG